MVSVYASNTIQRVNVIALGVLLGGISLLHEANQLLAQ